MCGYLEFVLGHGSGRCPACGVDQREHERECESCGVTVADSADEAEELVDHAGRVLCDDCVACACCARD